MRAKLVNNKFQYEVEITELNKKVTEGKLVKTLVDQVLVCPECLSIPTIRPGCPTCGSIHLKLDELIHHYRCGNVESVEYFIQPDKTLLCRKCKQEALVINKDYDVSIGLFRCEDCDWTGSSIKLIGHCTNCPTIFLVSEAYKQDLWEYEDAK